MALLPDPRPRHLRSIAGIVAGLSEVFEGLAAGRLPWPLFLHGPAGVGKSRAALAFLDHVAGPTSYYRLEDLKNRILQASKGRLFSPGGYETSEQALWNAIESADVAVLDEVGATSKPSDFERSTLRECLECREGSATFVLSNLTPAKLAALYDDRIASRCGSGTVFHLDGKDRRIERDDVDPFDVPEAPPAASTIELPEISPEEQQRAAEMLAAHAGRIGTFPN